MALVLVQKIFLDAFEFYDPKLPYNDVLENYVILFKGVLTKHMTDLNASGPNYLL